MKTAAFALALFAGTAAAATIDCTGVVFDDTNNNGVRDRGERGIKNVLVSNGTDIVKTDRNGSYTIEIDADDAIVFVIKPEGYSVPLDATYGIPRFSYLHKPAGSPAYDRLFDGVAPTGDLPESVDFALTRNRDEDETFSVLLFGDTQPYNQKEIDFLAHDVIEEIVRNQDNGADYAFGISLGDLVGDDLDLFDPLYRVMNTTGIGWWNVYGNHDMNFMSPDDAGADETFNAFFGPTDYAFQYGDAHFIVLDNVVWNGYAGMNRSGTKPVTNNYHGDLLDHQLAFVKNYLAHVPEDELVVLNTHIPLYAYDPESVHQVARLDELLEILSSHPRTLSFSGHTHVQEQFFFGSDMGYNPQQPNQFGEKEHHHFNAATASGSWFKGKLDEWGLPHTTMRDGGPNGYITLDIDGNDYAINFHPARMDKDFQISLWTPEEVAAGSSFELIANAFAGSPRCTVDYRLPGGNWRAMTRTVRTDPYVEAFNAVERGDERVLDPGQRAVNRPQDTGHIWTAEITAENSGVLPVTVRWTDLYGKTSSQTRLLRVIAAEASASAAP